jgi:hypothetical protein
MVPRGNDLEEPLLASDHRGHLYESVPAIEELEEQCQDGNRDSQNPLALAMVQKRLPVEAAANGAERSAPSCTP